MNDAATLDPGVVLSVRGSIVDVVFPGRLPEFYAELRAGHGSDVIIEVVSHLDPRTVRGIALTPTAGLARGARVIDTGRPLRVPVGDRLLGRMLNVFGETMDGKEEIVGGDWRSIHRPPVLLTQQGSTTEILETGIKAIDLLAPLERGGKGGLFGGAGGG